MSNLDADLFNLAMSDKARPLMDAVQQHIKENVEPITAEFFALDQHKTDRWSWHPRQLELLDGAKARAKESGLWNFFLPDSELGDGLANLDYAYIAAELGKYELASESLNCSAPDTGNMEVLERVGTPEQKRRPMPKIFPPVPCLRATSGSSMVRSSISQGRATRVAKS